MPLPVPSAGQSKQEFLAACMTDPTMVAEFTGSDQRYAVCLAQWGKRTQPNPTGGWPASPFSPTEGL